MIAKWTFEMTPMSAGEYLVCRHSKIKIEQASFVVTKDTPSERLWIDSSGDEIDDVYAWADIPEVLLPQQTHETVDRIDENYIIYDNVAINLAWVGLIIFHRGKEGHTIEFWRQNIDDEYFLEKWYFYTDKDYYDARNRLLELAKVSDVSCLDS